MSRDVSLDIRLRPLDTKRFVGDFVRKFGAWIPEGASVRTAHGDQGANAQLEDDLREFIVWWCGELDPLMVRHVNNHRVLTMSVLWTASDASIPTRRSTRERNRDRGQNRLAVVMRLVAKVEGWNGFKPERELKVGWDGLTCCVKKMTLCRFVDRLMVEKVDVK